MASILNSFLEKCESDDKDLRYMALTDLMNAMKTHCINWDERAARQVLTKLNHLINDANTEVQNLAMQCIASVLSAANTKAVQDTASALVAQAVSDNDKQRDVATTALKMIIAQVGTYSSDATTLCQAITTPLLGCICDNPADSILLDNLTLLNELCHRFGRQLENQHEIIADLMHPLLSNPRTLIQKRAIATVCSLGANLSPHVYEATMERIIRSFKEARQSSRPTLIYITFLSSLGREVGIHIAPYLKRIVPQLLTCLHDDDDDLREAVFRTLDMCAHQAAHAFVSFVNDTLTACLRYISHDPNYDYGDNDEDESTVGRHAIDDSMDEDEDSDTAFSDDDFSDDDDLSWKVRRAAVKCLKRLIITRSELLVDFIKLAGPVLIKQFREREENVLLEVIVTYTSLVTQVEVVEGVGSSSLHLSEAHSVLLDQLPLVVSRSRKYIQSKSITCREATLDLYRHLNIIIPGAFTVHLRAIVPVATAPVKLAALRFIDSIVETHSFGDISNHLGEISDLLVIAVSDSFYKTVSRALAIAASFVQILRPLPTSHPSQLQLDIVRKIIEAVKVPFESGNSDVEVRESSITCVGHILAQFGDCFDEFRQTLLDTLLARLTHEMTRVTAANSIEVICSSPVGVDLGTTSRQAMSLLTNYLKLTSKQLRSASLKALRALVWKYSHVMQQHDVRMLLAELVSLITPEEIPTVAFVMPLAAACVRVDPSSLQEIGPSLLEAIAQVLSSKSLDRNAFASVCECLAILVELGLPHDAVEEKMCRQIATGTLATESLMRLGIASAAAARGSDNSLRILLLDSAFSALVKDTGPIRFYHLHLIGALGTDLDIAQARPHILAGIQELLLSSEEELKLAAAHAIGNLVQGSDTVLRTLVESIMHDQKLEKEKNEISHVHLSLNVYALRQAAQEMIGSQSGRQLLAIHLTQIWETLKLLMDHPSENVRNLVAETLSILTLLDISKLLGELSEALQHENALIRACAVNVARYLLSKIGEEHRTSLRAKLPSFLLVICDPDDNVRRMALGTVKAALLTHLSLVIDVLDQVMDMIYQETNIRKELISDIQMGPFTHRVDRGADTRKAAYECLYSLLDCCPDRIVFSSLLHHVLQGLSDDCDIQILANLILMKACKKIPKAIVTKLDDICEALHHVITAEPQKKAVKQEIEKMLEVKRISTSCVFSLNALPGSDKSRALESLIAAIQSDKEASARWDELKHDTMGAPLMDISGDN